eukprot:1143541-Pelagomonas_calceolata.AAC.2
MSALMPCPKPSLVRCPGSYAAKGLPSYSTPLPLFPGPALMICRQEGRCWGCCDCCCQDCGCCRCGCWEGGPWDVTFEGDAPLGARLDPPLGAPLDPPLGAPLGGCVGASALALFQVLELPEQFLRSIKCTPVAALNALKLRKVLSKAWSKDELLLEPAIGASYWIQLSGALKLPGWRCTQHCLDDISSHCHQVALLSWQVVDNTAPPREQDVHLCLDPFFLPQYRHTDCRDMQRWQQHQCVPFPFIDVGGVLSACIACFLFSKTMQCKSTRQLDGTCNDWGCQ